MHASRRDVLRWLGALTASAAFAGGRGATGLIPLGCSSSSRGAAPAGGFFSPDQRRALSTLANAVLPPDDAPGGADLGAVAYVEALCTALDGPTPRILAGGPYSGRAAFADGTRPANDFATFQPIDRVTLTAWRLALFGSAGVPGGGPNDAVSGPVKGLRDQLKEGLAAAIAASPKPLDQLSPDELQDLFNGLEGAFRDLVVELVTQAAFAAPEYGGNPGLAGWKLVAFEGDVQPLGYSIWDDATWSYRERPEAPVSTPEPGTDPQPLDDDTRAFIGKIISLTSGKAF